MTITHTYDPPDRFIAGTVGEPGQRTFYLQARAGRRVTSVALEKTQVGLLADRLDQLLDDLETGGVSIGDAPGDRAPLDQPVEEEFRVGTMTIAYDPDTSRIVFEAFSATDSEEADPDEALVVRIDTATARSFSKRAQSVVAAGRPPCPLCGNPLDPNGHLCPRQNGFRRTQL